MQLRDPAHEVVHREGAGGLEHVSPGLVVGADRLEIQPEVEVGKAALVAAGLRGAGLGGRQHGSGFGSSCEEFEHLPHRHPRIGADGNDAPTGSVRPSVAGHTGKVPGHVFDIGRIHRAMDFELPAAVIEAVGIVERQAPLPELGLALRTGRDEPVEGVGRLDGPGREEEPDGVVEQCSRIGRGITPVGVEAYHGTRDRTDTSTAEGWSHSAHGGARKS